MKKIAFTIFSLAGLAAAFSIQTKSIDQESLIFKNIEALAKTEVNGKQVWQTMAYCSGSMELACSTKEYAYDCSRYVCIVSN